MQDLTTLLSKGLGYEVDPSHIFAENFPQFLAMYNFIAPSIKFIDRIVVMNYNTYMIYFIQPVHWFYELLHDKTVEIDGQVYRSDIDFNTINFITLRVKEEES